MARIAGTVHVTADGKTLDISGAVSVPLGNSAKTPIVSKNGNVHYAEEPIAPFVEGAFLVTPDFPIEAIMAESDMTVLVEFANGMKYSLSEAFVEGEANFESDGATVNIKFTGTEGRWL